jgi:hypothetical protein
MKWRTTVDEVPRGLETSDFEDWLWKREKPKHPGHLKFLTSPTATCRKLSIFIIYARFVNVATSDSCQDFANEWKVLSADSGITIFYYSSAQNRAVHLIVSHP